MISPMTAILEKSLGADRKLNILTAPTHERYETGLALTGHNFYAFRSNDVKDWNVKYGLIPKNYHLLDTRQGLGQVLLTKPIDLVLSQNKFGQYQILSAIAKQLHVPLVSLEHTLPVPQWSGDRREILRNMRGTVNVFISSFSIKEWGFSESDSSVRVIKHMVDTDVFNPGEQFMSATPYNFRDNVILSVVNDWVNRDWCCNFSGWQRITNGLPVKVLGDTPGLSIPAKSTQELVNSYRQSRVFLNTSTISPVPTALLEAMACGCAVVSTATCMIPEIIQNGVNGFISNDENELRSYCEMLLNNTRLANELGYNATRTIQARFHKNQFINNWNEVFYEVANKTYLGEF